MKKIIFAIFALAALALTSCEEKGINIMDLDASKLDNTKERCWEYTQTNSYGISVTSFMWASEQGLVLMLQASATVTMATGMDVKTSYKPAKANDYESCRDKIVGSF